MIAFHRVLIANRGEIAIRIARALNEMGVESVAIYSEEDSASLHVRYANHAVPLAGKGAAAYMDIEAIIAAARAMECQAVHPGYGFLSEKVQLAARCVEAGLTFIGPSPEILALFGDKARARALARECNIPTLAGLDQPISIGQAEAFFRSLGYGAVVVLKAIVGGGGRGIRVVRSLDDLGAAFERCQSEAQAAAGNGALYIERYLPWARHLEVQVIGDGHDVVHLWERECTLQRQHQKLIEVAPSPSLSADLRERLLGDAVRLAQQSHYKGLGTVEFLVQPSTAPGGLDYAFIEVNPRIQVEHTITEEVTGVDLIKAQLRIAGGATLSELGLNKSPPVQGFAVQARVNMERLQADGTVLPSNGQLSVFEPPSGPGVRVDTCGHAGFRPSPSFDSLLAKVIVHSLEPEFAAVLRRAQRALSEFRIEGIRTNLNVLRVLLYRPEVTSSNIHTRFLDEHAAEIAEAATLYDRLSGAASMANHIGESSAKTKGQGAAVEAPLQATVVSVAVSIGDVLPVGSPLVVLESMKMEHVVRSPVGGRVTQIDIRIGDAVQECQSLLWIEEEDVIAAVEIGESTADPNQIRPDLQEVLDRRHMTRDEARPDAVARRRARHQRTARENVKDLCDEGSFVEHGALVIAAQRARHPFDHLVRTTPADGIVVGVGAVNGALFPAERARCAVLAYDAMVLAGTQGRQGHRKAARILQLAEQLKLPVVIYAEGGGARPGDTESPGENMTFHQFARLSGKVPLVGIVAGYSFAGNAALLGCCDAIIATEGSSFGMGGPAMVEGGGLGVVSSDEIGPARMHYSTGCVDVLVSDEAEATDVARRYLAYFQGSVKPGACPDQRLLRTVIPEDRRRAYNMLTVIGLLADEGSVLELRGGFGRSIITALVRIDGRAVGVLANNPMHLAGAIDANAADKGARFLQLCDAFSVPVLQLCDTPGIMVGPTAEKTALLRHSSRMLIAGANLRTPAFTIVLRKAYGLGMVSMMGGAMKAPMFNILWPTGEIGPMGVEGAVRLAYRKETEAIEDPQARQVFYEERVAALYSAGKAVNRASSYDFDDVIDPAESRAWILNAIVSSERYRQSAPADRHAFISPW